MILTVMVFDCLEYLLSFSISACAKCIQLVIKLSEYMARFHLHSVCGDCGLNKHYIVATAVNFKAMK